ncbi:SDR family oxidoreductase [Paenibacillus athensensis]|uniref:Short-chain dehydrogenase n=1 Tax=Paenibacillus athensensis TaxID=1967502 RepID=A0A4Y8PPP2_9BACL|nr:SDR family oxidoreductase [Paenibacillus athensensis]MCD1261508.1 SDR family oxidoreductase [Paenibacillus athensensis]
MKENQPVALITGTSSGFGLLTAVELARHGYRVAATMRDLSRSTALLDAAQQAGVAENIHGVQLDVTDASSIQKAVQAVWETYGRIDVLVNNAGYALGGFTEEIDMDAWRQQLETNVFGTIAVTKAALPLMRAAGRGLVINISSVSGRFALPAFAPYATSKFAIEGFSEALRLEMRPFGVNVVLVEPGPYRTDIWEKGFAGFASRSDSPYKSRLEAILRYARRTAEASSDPAEVARLIARIAGHPRPKLRYPVGRKAALMLWLKERLPWRWIEAMLLRELKRQQR